MSFTECELSLLVLDELFLGKDSIALWTANTEWTFQELLPKARLKHPVSSSHLLKSVKLSWFCCFELKSCILLKFIKSLCIGDHSRGKPHATGASQLQQGWAFSHRRAAVQRTALTPPKCDESREKKKKKERKEQKRKMLWIIMTAVLLSTICLFYSVYKKWTSPFGRCRGAT